MFTLGAQRLAAIAVTGGGTGIFYVSSYCNFCKETKNSYLEILKSVSEDTPPIIINMPETFNLLSLDKEANFFDFEQPDLYDIDQPNLIDNSSLKFVKGTLSDFLLPKWNKLKFKSIWFNKPT